MTMSFATSTPPWLLSCLGGGRGQTVPPDLVVPCGTNGAIWDCRTAEESAMHNGEGTQDTASDSDLSSTNRDSILFWTKSSECPRDLHSSRAPHIRAQLGHPWKAHSGSPSWSWIPAMVCNLSANKSWSKRVGSGFETTYNVIETCEQEFALPQMPRASWPS